MPEQGEQFFFVYARQPQPTWQPFLFRPGGATGAVGPGAVDSLVKLVLAAPEFLNQQGEPAFCVAASVSALCGAKNQILVAIDEVGRVFIVACPDESQAEPYSSLAADVLAAAGRLWRMSYESCDALFRQSSGLALDEVVMRRARPTWDFDLFKPALERSLAQGRFPVLILTSRPAGPVKDVVTYLTSMNVEARTAGAVLEEIGGIQVAVPMPGAPVRTTETAQRPVGPSLSRGQAAAEAGAVVPSRAGATTERPSVPPYGTQEPAVPAGRVRAPLTPEPKGSVVPKEETPAALDAGNLETRQGVPPGAAPTHAAKRVAKPPGPGTKPGVMSGRRPPPTAPQEDREQR